MAQESRNSIAVVWVMRMGGVNARIIDSCTNKNKEKNFLYRPRSHIPAPPQGAANSASRSNAGVGGL